MFSNAWGPTSMGMRSSVNNYMGMSPQTTAPTPQMQPPQQTAPAAPTAPAQQPWGGGGGMMGQHLTPWMPPWMQQQQMPWGGGGGMMGQQMMFNPWQSMPPWMMGGWR